MIIQITQSCVTFVPICTSCPRQIRDFPSTNWILNDIDVYSCMKLCVYIYITYIASTDYNFLSLVCDDSPNEHLVSTLLSSSMNRGPVSVFTGTGFVAAQTMAKKGRMVTMVTSFKVFG